MATRDNLTIDTRVSFTVYGYIQRIEPDYDLCVIRIPRFKKPDTHMVIHMSHLDLAPKPFDEERP